MTQKLNEALPRPVYIGGYQHADPKAIEVSVRYVMREWPHGRIEIDGKLLTPNQTRRLVTALEKAIERAEDKFR